MSCAILILVTLSVNLSTSSIIPDLDLEHCSRIAARSSRTAKVYTLDECPIKHKRTFDFLKPPSGYERLNSIAGQSCVTEIKRFGHVDDHVGLSAIYVEFYNQGVWIQLANDTTAIASNSNVKMVPLQLNEIQIKRSGKPGLVTVYNDLDSTTYSGTSVKSINYINFVMQTPPIECVRTTRPTNTTSITPTSSPQTTLDPISDPTTVDMTFSTTISTTLPESTSTQPESNSTSFHTVDGDLLTPPPFTNTPTPTPNGTPESTSKTPTTPTPLDSDICWIIFLIISLSVSAFGLFVIWFVFGRREPQRRETENWVVHPTRTLPQLTTQKSYTGQTIIVAVTVQKPK